MDDREKADELLEVLLEALDEAAAELGDALRDLGCNPDYETALEMLRKTGEVQATYRNERDAARAELAKRDAALREVRKELWDLAQETVGPKSGQAQERLVRISSVIDDALSGHPSAAEVARDGGYALLEEQLCVATARLHELGHAEAVDEGESCCDACDRAIAAEKVAHPRGVADTLTTEQSFTALRQLVPKES